VGCFTVAKCCVKLARIGRELRADDTDLCNGVSDSAHLVIMRRREKQRAKLKRIGEKLGLVIEHQTDPRGATVKVWADKIDGRLLACF
jgi:hypothetical protein